MPQNQPTVPPIKIVNNKIVNINKTNDKTKPNEGKRNLSVSSTPPSSPSAIIAKKTKLFVTPNRYEALIADDESPNPDNDNNNIDIDSLHENIGQGQSNTTHNTPKSILPPPIFIKGVLDFIGLRNSIRDLIGPSSFLCKSSTAHLKIQTDNPDNYRKLIRLLKEINAQFHTYQLHSEKSLRIVVKNLHPTTPVEDIAAAIEEIGHSVKNVINIKHHQTKSPLPMFFVDLNPQESDNDIFSITALLHTKVKIEEPHKKREIPQCLNCQSYGHTRTYCAYPPKCVKCGDTHPTSSCIKPPDLPAKCALCSGPQPANYKGCLIFKQLGQKHPNYSSKTANTSSKTANISSKTANISSFNQQPLLPPDTSSSPGDRHQLDENSSTYPRSYANAAKGHPPNNHSNPTDNNMNDFTKFLDEFKSIINPLLSLLTQVLTNLINNINTKNAN